jgi:biopolymer transport protein ExbB
MAQIQSADGATAAVQEDAPAQIVKEISTLEFIMKGGVFLIPIAILLFVTLAIMVERYLYIRNMSKYNKHLLSEIKTNLQAGNIPPVLDTLSRDNTAFGNVVREGVLTIGRPISQIESNLEKVVNIEIGKMEKNIGLLGLIAGVAPTFGFIGTISGVIKIFYNISISENVSIGNISGGLYEKMISSCSGLVVGLVGYIGYHGINMMIDKFGIHLQATVMDFLDTLNEPVR